MSWSVSPWVYPLCNSLGFLDLSGCFFPHFREVLDSCPFHLSSSSGTPMIQMLGGLTLSQKFLRLFSFLFILFFCSALFISTTLSSNSRILFFCFSYSTVGSLQSVFTPLLRCSLLIDYSLFLPGPSQVFLASSQSVSLAYLSTTPLLFSRFWIIFIIITLIFSTPPLR